jgi:hypothetical protein
MPGLEWRWSGMKPAADVTREVREHAVHTIEGVRDFFFN